MEAAYRELTIQIDKAGKGGLVTRKPWPWVRLSSSNKDLGARWRSWGYKSKTVDKEFLQTVDAPFVDFLPESRNKRPGTPTLPSIAGSGVRSDPGTSTLQPPDLTGPGTRSGTSNCPEGDAVLKKAIRTIYKPGVLKLSRSTTTARSVRIEHATTQTPTCPHINDPNDEHAAHGCRHDLFFRGSPAEVRSRSGRRRRTAS